MNSYETLINEITDEELELLNQDTVPTERWEEVVEQFENEEEENINQNSLSRKFCKDT